MAEKTDRGNFFEDFEIGQTITHATPRTLTYGDAALYTALCGARFAVQASDAFAQTIGYQAAPLDDLLVFHTVFGKTVPDISLNAAANLGYADCRFLEPVYPGDTLSTTSEIIGLKQNSSGRTGVVYVRSTGRNQHGGVVLDYVRWVMVNKRDPESPAPETVLPKLSEQVAPDALAAAVPALSIEGYDDALAGSPHRWGDYQPGERIDHFDGMTIEEAEHQMATRLYHNTARVHFNQHAEKDGRFGRRLVYGGHIISLARALSFNGLANAFHITAINAGRHTGPVFAGDTIFAWTEVLAREEVPERSDVGALRLRTVATKNRSCLDFPHKSDDTTYDPSVVLEIDYWVVLPR